MGVNSDIYQPTKLLLNANQAIQRCRYRLIAPKRQSMQLIEIAIKSGSCRTLSIHHISTSPYRFHNSSDSTSCRRYSAFPCRSVSIPIESARQTNVWLLPANLLLPFRRANALVLFLIPMYLIGFPPCCCRCGLTGG